jgi:triacylglycerol lipase
MVNKIMPDNKPYPIVLAHGIAPFDFLTARFLQKINMLCWDLSLAFDRLHYFRLITTHLRNHQFDVYPSRVPFAARAEERAKSLAQEVLAVLEDSQQEKVHIIGHSMGGLDARRMIVQEDMADKVASVTTIGTPHLGTSFADFGLEHGGEQLINTLVDRSLDLTGFLDLTRDVWKTFNAEALSQEASNSVIYQTYAAAQERDLVFTPLRRPYEIVFAEEGENDGLVSVKSQRWTDKLVDNDGTEKAIIQKDFPIPADHLNQIGWWDISELRRAHWWRLDLIREKRRFEAAIRDAYLDIARTVSDFR